MQHVPVQEVPKPKVLLLRSPCTASHLFLYFFILSLFLDVCHAVAQETVALLISNGVHKTLPCF